MLVVLNGAREEGCIDVPEGDWHILIRNGTVDNAAIQVLKGGAVKIAPQSALILVR
jgi:pullulanase